MAKSIHVFMLILLLHVLKPALANKHFSLSLVDECSLLFQFKESMPINMSVYVSNDPDAYPKAASWNLNISNCCLWDGVECRFGHVIGLDLSNSFLYGPISSNSSIFNLVHLRTLNLAYNDFWYSQIPSGIGRLSQLAYLNLSDSYFSGEVPEQISHLRNLVSLNLSNNPLLELQSSDFKNLVQNSSKTLRELSLSDVYIGSEIPASIGNLTHLSILDLSSCAFTGTLPASVSNLTQLTALKLSYNEFTGSLPSLENFSNLTELDLGYNNMIGQIPSSLMNLTRLTVLDLSGNNFDKWKLPYWFGKLKKITNLDLSNVNLYGEIPSSLFNLTQVVSLDLSNNQLKGQLSSSLLNFQNLESFFLGSNKVSVDFDLFLSLKNLKDLNLSGNSITLPVIDSHTNETQQQFTMLAFEFCNLKVFPEFLRFQNHLKYLFLNNNNIEGLVPGWMWNISKETFIGLMLSHNLLTGFEQHSLVASWVGFGSLDLSHNMLHGSIPLPPPTTIIYSVSNNNLSGEIPPSICDLLSLELLDLSFNNITGSIPPCLVKLSNSSLRMLNLRCNTLQGTLPNIFTTGSKLEMIDLSENKLKGKVPRSLENCESLQILDLGYNFIGGMFPFWLGALSDLQVLILRFNKFRGIIRTPGNIKVNFAKLRIIDLSYNSFSGDLPHQYFQECSAMKETNTDTEYMAIFIPDYDYTMIYWFSTYMTNKGIKMNYNKIMNTFSAVDLSSNMFSGKIPESIKTLRGIQLLNLSNNELSGVIPPSMGNLMQLEALDLSCNKLSGMIPQELVQLNFLEVFNVSNNSLTGRIPQGKQFNTFSNNSYMGNLALCGYPLSRKCGNEKAAKPPNVSFEDDNEPDFPNGIDWVVIVIGFVSGLVIGLVCGDHLTTKYYTWLFQRLRM